MNLSVLLGLIAGAVTIVISATSEVKNASALVSLHGFLIVLGGTGSAALVCFPFSHFINLTKVFFRTVTGKGKAETLATITEIVRISESVNGGGAVSSEVGKVKNPFLKESLELLAEGSLNEEELDEVLEKRVEMQNERYKRDGQTFKIIGKFPPAFGLIGASLGMITLLQGLGEPDAFERLGPSMSIALTATFYGLVVANVFLIPLGENLHKASEDDLMMRKIVIDGIRLIREQKHPLLVEEYLKSYLAQNERTKLPSGARKAA